MNRNFVKHIFPLTLLMALALFCGATLYGCGGGSSPAATSGRLIFVLKDSGPTATSQSTSQSKSILQSLAKQIAGKRSVPTGTTTFRITVTQGTNAFPVWDIPLSYNENSSTHFTDGASYTNNLSNQATATGQYAGTTYNVTLPSVPLVSNLNVQVRTYAVTTPSVASTLDSSTPTASFSKTVDLTTNSAQTVAISLNTTVSQFVFQPQSPELAAGSAPVQVTATPLDANGNNVFVDPSQLQWASSDSTIMAVAAQPGTSSALLTPGYIGTNPQPHPTTKDLVGTATISVTETGFGITAQMPAYTRINVVITAADKTFTPTLGSVHTFQANVYGLLQNAVPVPTGAVTWSLTNLDGSAVGPQEGSIDPTSGKYLAPNPSAANRPTTPGLLSKSYLVTATSVKDPNQTDTTTFKVQVGSTSISIN